MSRLTSGAFDTANAAAHREEVIFIEFQFASGSSFVCTRDRDVVWDGQTWLGRGRVGTIEPLEESAELAARGIVMTLSGLPTGLLALALDPSEYKSRPVKLWAGLIDTSSAAAHTIVADPVGPFTYRMDSLEFELGETATLRLTAESRLADWDRPRMLRYNDADQQLLYPGDKFFERAEAMVDAELVW